MGNFVLEWNDCFEFNIVPPEKLAPAEKSVFDMTHRIADLVGGLPSSVQGVKISETMRPEKGSFSEACGLWTGSEIIVKRSELSSVERYASVLLHEIAHARSGEVDVTSGFEQELTSLLGMVASEALRKGSTHARGWRQEPAKTRAPEIPAARQPPQAASRRPAPVMKARFWARLFGKR